MKMVLFVLVVVVAATVVADAAETVREGSKAAVYGGIIGLLAGNYWQQRTYIAQIMEKIDKLQAVLRRQTS